MKVLFVATHDGFARMFEPMLRGLTGRGHEVRLGLERRGKLYMSAAESLEDLAASLGPGFTHETLPKVTGRLARLELGIISTRDLLRYHTPEYANADRLRERAVKAAPDVVSRLPLGRPVVHRPLDAVLRVAEGQLPPPPQLLNHLRKRRPDVVLVSPLVSLGSLQSGVLRAARELGIPSALLVHSWDNLTNKGLIHGAPDRVVVWNEAQRREAVELHGVARDAVVITGAQGFDHWFGRAPSTGRAEFAARVGLPDDGRFVLYACSSRFIAPDEVAIVREWLAGLRADPRFDDLAVLVRPHPQHSEQWRDVDLGPRTAIWPGPDVAMVGTEAQDGYYDSIHHSAAVVGVNTSAFVETAIQERPVLTLGFESARAGQDGTLHFALLSDPDEGLVYASRTADEHAAQLAAALDGTIGVEDRARRFLEHFVRPCGLERPAADVLVEAVEALAEVTPTSCRRLRLRRARRT